MGPNNKKVETQQGDAKNYGRFPNRLRSIAKGAKGSTVRTVRTGGSIEWEDENKGILIDYDEDARKPWHVQFSNGRDDCCYTANLVFLLEDIGKLDLRLKNPDALGMTKPTPPITDITTPFLVISHQPF